MGELIDLVDADGRVQVKDVERDDAVDYGDLYMQIVIVVIFNGLGEVLVHQRASNDEVAVEAGKVDVICGAVQAGENPKETGKRETTEEAGLNIDDFQLVTAGVNEYKRYRYLLVARSDDQPKLNEPRKMTWQAWRSVEELEQARDTGQLKFTYDFFEEVALAQQKLNEEVA